MKYLYTPILAGDLLGIYQSFSSWVNLPLGDIAQCQETPVCHTGSAVLPLPSHTASSQPLSLLGIQWPALTQVWSRPGASGDFFGLSTVGLRGEQKAAVAKEGKGLLRKERPPALSL